MPSTKVKNVSSSRKSEGQILDLEKGKVNFLFITVMCSVCNDFKINIFKVRNRRKVSSKVFYKSKKRVTIDAIDKSSFGGNLRQFLLAEKNLFHFEDLEQRSRETCTCSAININVEHQL